MKLVLEIISGPATGRCFALPDDRVTTFGRTDAADHSLPEDNYLSRCHFAVRFDTDENAWQIRDLESRHGTSVNGEKILETHLPEATEITAGRTVFQTRITEDDEATPEALAATAAALAVFTAVAASNRVPARLPKFKRAKGQAGLLFYTSEDTDPSPASMAWLIAQQQPLYLIADFVKAGMPFPQQLEQREYLFNWADEEVLAEFSPVVLSPEDPVDPYEIIDGLWGKDALVCVFSNLEKEQLVAQLRCAVRADDGKSKEPPKGLAGCCWPEAARPMLATAPERFIRPLLDGGQIYLMEGEPPGVWHLAVPQEHDRAIRSLLEG